MSKKELTKEQKDMMLFLLNRRKAELLKAKADGEKTLGINEFYYLIFTCNKHICIIDSLLTMVNDGLNCNHNCKEVGDG